MAEKKFKVIFTGNELACRPSSIFQRPEKYYQRGVIINKNPQILESEKINLLSPHSEFSVILNLKEQSLNWTQKIVLKVMKNVFTF